MWEIKLLVGFSLGKIKCFLWLGVYVWLIMLFVPCHTYLHGLCMAFEFAELFKQIHKKKII